MVGETFWVGQRPVSPLKNTLQEEDARTIEAAYQKRLEQDALPRLI